MFITASSDFLDLPGVGDLFAKGFALSAALAVLRDATVFFFDLLVLLERDLPLSRFSPPLVPLPLLTEALRPSRLLLLFFLDASGISPAVGFDFDFEDDDEAWCLSAVRGLVVTTMSCCSVASSAGPRVFRNLIPGLFCLLFSPLRTLLVVNLGQTKIESRL